MFFAFEFKVFERVGKRVPSLLILYLTISALEIGRLVGLGTYSPKGLRVSKSRDSCMLFIKKDLSPKLSKCMVELRHATHNLGKGTSHFLLVL